MNKSSKEIAIEGFLVGLSITTGIVEHQFNILGFSMLQGLSLLPIFFIQDMFGLKTGFWCLFSSTLIRSILFSCAGIFGFLARMSAFFYMIFRNRRTTKLYQIYIFDLIGIIISIFVKIPFAYSFWRQIYNYNGSTMMDVIIKVIIPTNFLRLLIVVLLSRIIKMDNFKKYYMVE